MAISRVLIFFKPDLYADLFRKVFQVLGAAEVVELGNDVEGPSANGGNLPENVDVIIFSLDEFGQPAWELLPEPIPDAKLIALSPSGDQGYLLSPGDTEWRKLRPFGLQDLIGEVSTPT
jgi:hypothetical protein